MFIYRTAVSTAKLDRQLCGPVDRNAVVEPPELPWRQDRYRVQGDVRHVRSVRRIYAQQREYITYYIRVLYLRFISSRASIAFILIIIVLLFFFHHQEVFNDTKITISGLSPVTTYKFHVWVENGVSNLTSSENRQFVDIAVTTTEASMKSASVNNVRVMLVKPSEIALSWDPPMTMSYPDSGDDDTVEIYEVSLRIIITHTYIHTNIQYLYT